MHFFSPNSPFGRWMGFLLDTLLVSFLWLALCIPVITIGPATAALHKVAYNWMQNRSENGVKYFWEAFVANLKTGILVWLILLLPLLLILFNGYAVWITELETNAAVKWMTLLGGLVWLSTAVYALPLQALFENKPWRTVINALRIAASHLGKTLILDVLFGLAIVMTLLLPVGAALYVPACCFLGARPVWSVFRRIVRMTPPPSNPEGEA